MQNRITNSGRRVAARGLLAWIFVAVLALPALSEEPPAQSKLAESKPTVSFRHDVMAVLSKAGCNAGTCHGNQNGKGGFRLSLRGQDPDVDWLTLTHDATARRTNLLEPERSLILLKPTAQMAHEGGRRFAIDSQSHEILRQWIAAGMPNDSHTAPALERIEVAPSETIVVDFPASLPLNVTAFFKDGTHRDVTTLAVYEPITPVASVSEAGMIEGTEIGETTVLVRYLEKQAAVRLAFVRSADGYTWQGPAEANYVDHHVFAKLRTLRENPTSLVNDSVFVRRVYLDLLGILPTSEEARQFVADVAADKRTTLVDSLVARDEFADYWALTWCDLLGGEEKQLDRKGVQNFHHWIRDSIIAGKPLNQMAAELLAARGSTYTNPPTNFYRAHRDPTSRAEAAAQVFLGIRLQCARCHNHPFERWTQGDYYGWSAVFAPVEYKILENNRRDSNDSHEFDGEQIVWMARNAKLKDPRTRRPAPPTLLGGAKLDADDDSLEALADWIGDPKNPYFAAAQANRVWYHLFGQGIVDPVDDLRATNPAINPPLLAALGQDLADHHYDLRHLVRVIASSSTYQLAAASEDKAGDALRANFGASTVRRLTAEQLLDALSGVLGVSPQFNGYPRGMRAGQLPGVQAIRPRDQRPSDADLFLKIFGKPPRLMACECERSNETTLKQVFQLISGPLLNEWLTEGNNRLGALLSSDQSTSGLIEEFYWSALSRPPSDEELMKLTEFLDKATDRRAALEDVVWGLVNAPEFVLRQ